MQLEAADDGFARRLGAFVVAAVERLQEGLGLPGGWAGLADGRSGASTVRVVAGGCAASGCAAHHLQACPDAAPLSRCAGQHC